MGNINNLIITLKKKYDEWEKKEADRFAALVFKFSAVVIIYGVLINTVTASLFGSQFWVGSVIGYGLLFYFFTDELPDWVRKIRRAR